MRFRKRPIVIEAVRASDLLRAASRGDAAPSWISEAWDRGELTYVITKSGGSFDAIHIKTLEGAMRAEADDWVIRGVKGELYPCKPDIFDATYEEVE